MENTFLLLILREPKLTELVISANNYLLDMMYHVAPLSGVIKAIEIES